MIIKIGIGTFEIKNRVVVDTINDIELKDVSIVQLIARQLVDDWWENRSLVVEGKIVKLADPFNARQIPLALALGEDLSIVDIHDETIMILADDVLPLAKKLKAETARTMQFWDEAIDTINAGNWDELLVLIEATRQERQANPPAA